MLKKVGIVVGATTAVLLAASPLAFAGGPDSSNKNACQLNGAATGSPGVMSGNVVQNAICNLNNNDVENNEINFEFDD